MGVLFWLWLIPASALYVLLCVHVGIGAKRRGRDGVLWALYAFFLSPLIAGFSPVMPGTTA